jgi:hypothetical protein
MDFDKIKELMDDENQDGFQLPTSLESLKESQMPIAKVRKTMKSEIITQLICIVIFLGIAFIRKMHELPHAVYLVLMIVTCLITSGYIVKMIWFLKRTSNVGQQTRETILRFIHDIQLTMEVYKTGIIAGSLLLPISMTAMFMGTTILGKDHFSEWFLLQMSTTTLLLVILGYLISGVFIYYITVKWADKLYGVHIDKLKEILDQMEE